MPTLSRRSLIRGAAGLTGMFAVGGVSACSTSSVVGPTAEAVAQAEAARRRSGASVVSARLSPRPATVDLGGRVVETWAFGDRVPGPLLRATAGDVLRVDVDNSLPVETSVHWHGLALRNDMDGVPGMTQDPIAAGRTFRYEFVAPHPGTYFYHPHSGVQLDRGLYGVLVVDDPAEPGAYDVEWVVVLDDWLDGTGRTPEEVLEGFLSATSGDMEGMEGMEGMDHGSMEGMEGMEGMDSMDGMEDMPGMGMKSEVLGEAGDVEYPHYLVNGRVPTAPMTLTARPGQRARVRFVNAASDTAFRVAVGGHRMTVTHSDGFPVAPVDTEALIIGMGERYDVTIALEDGVFPLVASPEGKQGQGLAVVRTGSGASPAASVRPAELSRSVLLGYDLAPAESVRLEERSADRTHDVLLEGSMSPYVWTINGARFHEGEPLPLEQGERVVLRFRNETTMFHPMHVHGHTFAVRQTGVRKDTVIVRPRQTLEVELEADNPGQWATHCHNIYHAEAGMMATLSYRA